MLIFCLAKSLFIIFYFYFYWICLDLEKAGWFDFELVVFSIKEKWILIILWPTNEYGQFCYFVEILNKYSSLVFQQHLCLARIFWKIVEFWIGAIWTRFLIYKSKDVSSYFLSRLFVHIARIWPSQLWRIWCSLYGKFPTFFNMLDFFFFSLRSCRT